MTESHSPPSTTADALVAGRGTFIGLIAVALSTLTYEILLTRIFSVTLYYHFAFVAVSIALFGMTAGAVGVHVFAGRFAAARTRREMALAALLFGVTLVLSFVAHVRIPIRPETSGSGLALLLVTYVLVAVPFVFSGVCVCLALTRFPGQVGRLYAADLLGAAAGCPLLIVLLNAVDGPTAVLVIGCISLLGAAAFAWDAGRRGMLGIAVGFAAVCAAGALANRFEAVGGRSWLRLIWVKGSREQPSDFERWNSFSRVSVRGDPAKGLPPQGWGLSSTYPADRTFPQLYMSIDATAGTFLTRFDGDPESVDFLRYDVTNAAHYLRPGGSVLVIGAGGGRDVLSALVFGQKRITAVEINASIIAAVNDVFGDFTGHLDRRPGVTFVNDEARSFVARSLERYDIIQISLIDTWAATAAGAYVLSENSLYTVEAWTQYLKHLTDDGILSVSRWYRPGEFGETHRVAALANAALRRVGVSEPRAQIVILGSEPARGQPEDSSRTSTTLVCRRPFTPAELDELEKLAASMKFPILLSPRTASDEVMAELASNGAVEPGKIPAALNLSAPTDDRPFFFNMARLSAALDPAVWRNPKLDLNLRAVRVLTGLLAFVLVISLFLVVPPYFVHSRAGAARGSAGLTLFFASIGLGFILIEISQIQRLIVLLGHPTYTLSVVLFALLVSGGIGSFATRKIADGSLTRSGAVRIVTLIGVLLVVGFGTPMVVDRWQSGSTPVRIGVALGMLVPTGYFMGMAFPIGMRLANRLTPAATAWLWALNGAMSVVASVLAVVIAMGWGISSAWWSGTGCYVIALAALAASARSPTFKSSE